MHLLSRLQGWARRHSDLDRFIKACQKAADQTWGTHGHH
jgi:hypothetical protein